MGQRLRRDNYNERRRKYKRRKKRNRIILISIVVLLLLAVIAVVGFVLTQGFNPRELWHRYSATDERADLNMYFGIRNPDDLAVIIDNQVVRDMDTGGRMFDGVAYLEFAVLRQQINGRFYWDYNEQLLLYTLPTGTVSVRPDTNEYTHISEPGSMDHVIVRMEGGAVFVSLPFIQVFTNMEFRTYEAPNRLVLTTDWEEKQVVEIRRDTAVRFQGGPQSPVLTEVERGDILTFLEEEGDWRKVATSDGFIGYVPENTLYDVTTQGVDRIWEEPVWTNITRDHLINMSWDDIHHPDANYFVQETIDRTHGLTAIAPTWFSIRDIEGNIDSIASEAYVQIAHQNGLEVWVTFRDFHGGIDSFEESYQVLSRTSNRERMAEQVIAETLRVGADGINLDFEKISLEAGPHFVQFVRELSVLCREHALLFTIANLPPFAWNAHYDMAEQARVADYIIIMGYDEFYDGSPTPGPVASFDFVRFSIETALEMVPAERLINALPFYARLWLEVPKTEEDLAAQAGTEAANFPNHVSSSALGMGLSRAAVEEAGVVPTWDPEARMYFAAWETPEGRKSIWLEEERSLREKLVLMQSLNLAGVGSWRLGLEQAIAWDVIAEFY
ncbi:MAG: glycosyl hydrolase family 18 protein [Lachnospiraceae bacterium]|nr:glycosyl hydrolase family 18 protein [Lachnospiraceae bacterium]